MPSEENNPDQPRDDIAREADIGPSSGSDAVENPTWKPREANVANNFKSTVASPLIIIPALGICIFMAFVWFVFLKDDGVKPPAPTDGQQVQAGTRVNPAHLLSDIPQGILPEGASFEPGVTRMTGDKLVIDEIELPWIENGHAIWGSVGRDHRGHIWIGITASQGYGSLLEYNPIQQEIHERGTVELALSDHKLLFPGTTQTTLHSRIVQAPDGYLYFCSMETRGQIAKSQTASQWGSHLWRIHPRKGGWVHVAKSPTALVALSCTGRYVYCLGYFGHVIYQYDTKTGEWTSVRVGSVGGHVSRNLISDKRGHVFVPRVTEVAGSIERKRAEAIRSSESDKNADASTKFRTIKTPITRDKPRKVSGKPIEPDYYVELVEYDRDLHELRATPLTHYQAGVDGHGITGLQLMADDSIIFSTSVGYLYQILPQPADSDAAARIVPLRYLHPDGPRYVASLFTVEGERYVMGIARDAKGNYDWVTYDLVSKIVRKEVLDLPREEDVPIWRILIYGSIARDHVGRFYIVGTDQKNNIPVVYRIAVP